MQLATAPIQFTAPVAIRAAKKGPRRFHTTAYTGGALLVGGYDLPVVVDLAGLTARRKVSANLDHNPSQRVGHVDEIQNDGRSLVLAGAVSAASAAAAEFVASHDTGYPWQASIEAHPGKLEEIPRDQSIIVNSQTFSGPLYVARKSQLSGIAFVGNGADDNTAVSIAARRSRAMSFPQFVDQMTDTPVDELTPSQLAHFHASYEGRTTPTAADREAVAPMIAASADPVDVENKRLRQIERATKGDWGDDQEKVQELHAQAIKGELTVDELLADLRDIRSEQFTARIPAAHTVTSTGRRPDEQVITAALCLTAGIDKPEAHFSEQVLDAADKMQDVGIQSMLLRAAAENGYRCQPGTRITTGNLREVLAHASPPIHATGFTTISLPDVFSNTANKFLMTGWDSVDQTALRIAARRSARDFKEMTTVSLIGDATFEQLPPQGELKHGTLGQTTYTNKVDTYGIIYQISRTDIINDYLDALSVVPRRIGRGGMLKLNDITWTAFLDNASFFTAGNNNISTGAGSALSSAGLQAAEKIFLNQTDPDGEPLGVMPQILLVPPSLKATALELMNSALVVTGSDPTRPDGNIWQSRFRVESSPYMENSNYTGNSDAAWYLLASPGSLAAIEIAALNGRVEPTVETADADFATLGVQMRGYSDVGVRKQEPRAGVRSAGA